MNLWIWIETYLPEILTVLGILIPTLPTIITRITSDARVSRMLSTFKADQSRLSDVASKQTVDVGRLAMNVDKLDKRLELIENMAEDMALIRRQLGIKDRPKL